MATRKRKAAEPKPKTTKRAKVADEDFELVDADKEFTLSIERCNR